jgi:hypothetical protein
MLAATATASSASQTSQASSQLSVPSSSQVVVTDEGDIRDADGRVVGGWKEISPAAGESATATMSADSYTKVYVGDGVWEYGVYYDSADRKHCWSKYYNIYYYHSATAQMNTTLKVYAYQFEYADAHLTVAGAFAQTCKVYWSNYY